MIEGFDGERFRGEKVLYRPFDAGDEYASKPSCNQEFGGRTLVLLYLRPEIGSFPGVGGATICGIRVKAHRTKDDEQVTTYDWTKPIPVVILARHLPQLESYVETKLDEVRRAAAKFDAKKDAYLKAVLPRGTARGMSEHEYNETRERLSRLFTECDPCSLFLDEVGRSVRTLVRYEVVGPIDPVVRAENANAELTATAMLRAMQHASERGEVAALKQQLAEMQAQLEQALKATKKKDTQ